jgi:phosphate acyltransferase
MARVALDMLGGDGAPGVVADAVALIGTDIDLILVGPQDQTRSLLRSRGVTVEAPLVHTDVGVPMAADPLTTLRATPNASVMLAAGAVRDGIADAWVSVGHTGAAVAAAALVLGRTANMARPALAVVMPALHGPVVLLDAGASLDVTPDVLVQYGIAGAAYARTLGIDNPRVGLLSIGTEPGKGDPLRRVGYEVMAAALPPKGIRFAGFVEGQEAALGRTVDVIVTDGFTGNVLLKAVEGSVAWSAIRMGDAYGDRGPALRVMHETASGDFAGGMLLGVEGVTVIGHGAATPDHIVACIRLASNAADHGLTKQVSEAIATSR